MKTDFRPRLTEEEYNIIKGIRKACKDGDLDVSDVKHGWIKNNKSSLFFKNPLFKSQENKDFEKLKEGVLDWTKATSTKVKKFNKRKGSHLLLIDPADVHIGKLCTHFETGDEYNSKIAVQRVLEGVQGIIDKSKGFDIDEVVLVGGNDILHIDTPKRTTTSGTPQDTDRDWETR